MATSLLLSEPLFLLSTRQRPFGGSRDLQNGTSVDHLKWPAKTSAYLEEDQ